MNSWILILFVFGGGKSLWVHMYVQMHVCTEINLSVVSQALSLSVLMGGFLLVWSLLVGLGWWASKITDTHHHTQLFKRGA